MTVREQELEDLVLELSVANERDKRYIEELENELFSIDNSGVNEDV